MSKPKLDVKKILEAAKENLERDGELVPTLFISTDKALAIAPLIGMRPENKREMFQKIGEEIKNRGLKATTITIITL